MHPIGQVLLMDDRALSGVQLVTTGWYDAIAVTTAPDKQYVVGTVVLVSA